MDEREAAFARAGAENPPNTLPPGFSPEQLADSVSDAVISTDADRRITSWNRAAERIYGWTAREAIGRGVHELLCAECDNSDHAVGRLRAEGQISVEAHHRTKGGKPVTLAGTARLLRDGGAVMVLTDITRHRRMEEQLRRQTAELAGAQDRLAQELSAMGWLHRISTAFVQEGSQQSLLDMIADAAVGITGAGACAILYHDAATESMRVVSQRGLPDAFVRRVDRAHAEQVTDDRILAAIGALNAEDAFDAHAAINMIQQESMAEENLSEFRSTPLVTRTGKVLGVLAVFQREAHRGQERQYRLMELLARLTADIMERTNAERNVAVSNKMARLLYDVVEKLLERLPSQELIREICEKVMDFLGCSVFLNYLVDGDGQWLTLNASAGIDAARLEWFTRLPLGRPVCGWVVQHGCRIVVNNLQKSADEGLAHLKSIGLRAYACHPLVAGDTVIGTLSFGAIGKDSFTDEDLALMKAVCGHVAVALNRMRSEENLARMAMELGDKSRLVTDFFTNISHEFKTPLSIILVSLQMMEYRIRDMEEDRQEALGKAVVVMRQNALRLLRLIGNLLDVTKIDAGFMKASFVRTDIVEMVRGLTESVGDIAANAGLGVRFESACGHLQMPLDAEKMERIMLNLLSNAIKHTSAGGSILVSIADGHDRVTISVKDNGEGIPYDRQDVIFDRFRQANSSLTRSSEGCGIGLALTRALVELLKGRVWFTSTPGLGSEFFVELPVLDEDGQDRTIAAEAMPFSRKLEMEFSDIVKIGPGGRLSG